MRVWSLVGLLGFIAWIGNVSAFMPPGESEAVQQGWLSSLDEGREAAKATGKPLMVVFRCVP